MIVTLSVQSFPILDDIALPILDHTLKMFPFFVFFLQAYADSDVDLFTWGTPITTLALFTILLHLGIETKTWVRSLIVGLFMTIHKISSLQPNTKIWLISLSAAFSHLNQHLGFARVGKADRHMDV